ncbi:MAG TPA: hypothetical protein VMW34_03940 [Anaerolineales bacterium]|nr:hypothetical protein [Anaerolineales bacterium]
MNTRNLDTTNLPVNCDLMLMYASSLVIALLMIITSVAGILYPTIFYSQEGLQEAFIPNDVVNLIIGVPILLGSLWLAHRGKLIGLLFWPGALFYVFYTYVVYLLSMPLNAAFLLDLTLVSLSAYTMIGLVACLDGKRVQDQLSGAVPERASGAILAGLAVLFFVRAGMAMANAILDGTPLGAAEIALNAADFLIAPAWVIGGIMLWQRKALGYVTGLGLLYQASMLFIGLIFVLFLQPLITPAQFLLTDVLVVFVMGLVCFIPFILFVRGVLYKSSTTPL